MQKVIFSTALFILAMATMLTAATDTGRNGDPEPVSQKLTFQDFLKQFPSAGLPYSFSEQDLKGQLDARTGTNARRESPKRLAWEYYEFLPDLEKIAEVSSMPIYPEPVASFETEKHYAVAYNTGRAFAKQYKTYNIALFDKNGVHQATYCIAGVQIGTLTAATLDEQLHVTIKEYEIKWEKDPVAEGIKGNNVSEIMLVNEKHVSLMSPDKSFLSPYQLPNIFEAGSVAGTN
jgi:hypothetical protein